jgi:putative tryptophan/tyrosine transport system substrate-binding protein
MISDSSPFGAPFIRGLAQYGYVLGHNVEFEHRAAEGHVDRLPRLLDELAASKVDVLVTSGYPPALAAKQKNTALAVNQKTTIPVVAFAAGDPVSTGLVSSLARPGGDITGISDVSAELTPKRMELLKQIAPALKRVAILWNAGDLGMTMRYRASETGAKALGISVQPLGVREPDDFEEAFAAMNREVPDAILMVSDSLTTLNRKRVFEFAAAHRLPAIYEFDSIVRDGGLMSYAPDLDESFARVAALVDRILKGARPKDLPFEQPTRFKLAINMKTAKALGLEVPTALLATADEVIE